MHTQLKTLKVKLGEEQSKCKGLEERNKELSDTVASLNIALEQARTEKEQLECKIEC